ncbi:MAG TPA: 50S ribosomal protein L11 methyltransferase [bacterium]|nr:50S ribosomal protein L11 methyltransferase [bacterium]
MDSPDTAALEVAIPTQSEELWSLLCHEQGCLGAEWLQEGTATARLRYFFPDLNEERVRSLLQAFEARFPHQSGPTELRWQRVPGEPWHLKWREHFAPLPVGERLLVCPPWDTGAGQAEWVSRLRVVIDPGQGFGTGQHPSTALALRLLEQMLGVAASRTQQQSLAGAGSNHPSVLDVGTGSGILAIAAQCLGAGRAVALDLDPAALADVRRNAACNGLPVPGLAQGGPACLKGSFDVVLANITAAVLVRIADDLTRLTSPGRHLILSGMLLDERPTVQQAYAVRGFTARLALDSQGWTALLLRRG